MQQKRDFFAPNSALRSRQKQSMWAEREREREVVGTETERWARGRSDLRWDPETSHTKPFAVYFVVLIVVYERTKFYIVLCDSSIYNVILDR